MAPYTNFYTPENANFYANFQYIPLDKGNEEIRLLEIDTSGSGNHKMAHAVPLCMAGLYSAISYYSGDPKSTESIRIDGIEMNIFANLARGIDLAISFWKGQSPHQGLRLWVDQICINQSDSAEKSHQVNFMWEIYRRANQVYISMPTEKDLRPAIQWLKGLSAKSREGYEPSSDMLYQNIFSNDNQETPEDPRWPAPVWADIYEVLRHHWWSRSWVYQELVVASRVVFSFSNEFSMRWEEIHPLLSLFLKLDTLKACSRGMEVIDRVDKSKKRYRRFISNGTFTRSIRRAVWTLIWPSRRGTEGFWKPDADWSWHHDSDLNSCPVCCCLCTFYLPCIIPTFIFHLTAAAGPAFIWVVSCGFFRWPFCPGCDVRRTQANKEGLQEHIEPLANSGLSQARIERVIQGKSQWESQKYAALSNLLQHSRNTETSNPKDKIYAFLGLAHPWYEIPINYDLSYSMNTVLSDVARAIVLHELNGLNILAQAGTASNKRRLPQGSDPLPTWVPDWDIVEDNERQKFTNALELPPNSFAGGSSRKSVSFSADKFANNG